MEKLKTSFGKLKVNQNQKTTMVQNLFTNVTQKYDLMNDLMSLGFHRLWKKRFLQIINAQPHDCIIDVGTGTSDIAFKIHKECPSTLITAIDLNLKMIKYGKQKTKYQKNNIRWVNCNAENLPFDNHSFDKYVISFCLRNITFVEKALNEALRVLKPGGCFYCLEFSTPKSFLTKKIYNYYKSKLIPLMGDIVINNKNAYKYLNESIDNFPQQKILLSILSDIGFENLSIIDIFDGIVSIHKGYKT